MGHRIDIDRGVTISQIIKFDDQHRFKPDPAYGGMTVYMYMDNPGVYYDVHGNEIPEGMAKLAGFPVDKLAKARRKKSAMADFEKRLAQELAIEADEEIILMQKGDWKMIALPMDRAKIVDKDTGDLITPVPLSRADAEQLLSHLVGTAEVVQDAVAEDIVIDASKVTKSKEHHHAGRGQAS